MGVVGGRVERLGLLGVTRTGWKSSAVQPSHSTPEPVRVTTAFNRLLKLDGVNVTDVVIGAETVVVSVALKRRRLVCPECDYTTAARYDTRPKPSRWRHLALGTSKLVIAATLRRLQCPVHGWRVEGVPFARPGARFTRDFETVVAWSATAMDKRR